MKEIAERTTHLARPTHEEADAEQLASFVVDQVVIDGVVDGRNKRAPLRMLVRIAFQGARVTDEYFQDFNKSLITEARFVDRVEHDYGYRPELSPDSIARASMQAIVSGQASCTDEERKNCMKLMEDMATILFNNIRTTDGVVSIREINGTLKRAGYEKISYEQWGGFMEFMRQDQRFSRMEDGRVVLLDFFRGDLGNITPAKHLTKAELGDAIASILPTISTSKDGTFTEAAILSKLKTRGIYVRPNQIQDMCESLALLPDVELRENGRYWLDRDKVGQEDLVVSPDADIESKIRAIKIPSSRKHRGKRGFRGNINM